MYFPLTPIPLRGVYVYASPHSNLLTGDSLQRRLHPPRRAVPGEEGSRGLGHKSGAAPQGSYTSRQHGQPCHTWAYQTVQILAVRAFYIQMQAFFLKI